jgi:hypothetical protein
MCKDSYHGVFHGWKVGGHLTRKHREVCACSWLADWNIQNFWKEYDCNQPAECSFNGELYLAWSGCSICGVCVCLVLQRAANSDINEDVHVSFLCSQDMGWRCWLIFNRRSSCKLSILATSVSTTFGCNCSEPQLIPIFGILSLMELLGFTCILVLELPQKVTLWMFFNVADHLSQSGDGSLYHLRLNVSTLEVVCNCLMFWECKRLTIEPYLSDFGCS